jgi:Skp family chaperone for outer membrane proteins
MLRPVALGRGLLAVGVTAVALVAGVASLTAQEAAVTKMAVFNADRIMAESQAGQQALALFNQLRDQRVGELQTQQEEINGLRQQGLAADPNSVEAAQLARQIEDRMVQLDRLQQDVQQELGNRQNELTGGITQLVGQIIEEVGLEQGYDLIFNSVQSGLVFVDPSMDITDVIIQRLDAADAGGPGDL